MKNKLIMLCVAISLCTLVKTPLSAQQTITISGPTFKDAVIYKDTRPGYEYLADNNYSTYTRISATAWTHSGSKTYWRTLLYFDLSAIPPGSTINSANLYFYSDPTKSSSSASDGNSQLSGSNAFYLEKVIGLWDESTVTWNNQPETTTSGRLYIGPSTSTTENKQINIKSLVQSWVDSPAENLGLKMLLENELNYRSRNYASTDHSNSAIRPKLVVNYTPSTLIKECDTQYFTESEMKQLPWYGNENFLNNYYDSLEAANGGSVSTLRVAGDIEYPWLRVPVKFWIYRNNDGTPGGTAADFPNEVRYQRMMDDLNNACRNNGINIRFYMKDVTPINKTSALELNGNIEARELATLNSDNTAVNVHIVNTISGGAGGVTYPAENVIFIPRGAGLSALSATSITHEMGHFFGLAHTHNFFDAQPCFREPVSRGILFSPCAEGLLSKRCLFTGDLLCDTQADPNMGLRKYADRLNACVWTPDPSNGLPRDAYKTAYRPDTHNYMAYGNRDCRSEFSDGQKKVMLFWAYNRQYRPNWVRTASNTFDRHEPDDADIAAREITVGQVQTHTFHTSGRTDNVDWLRFHYPALGSIFNYQLIITQTTASAVGAVNIYVRNTTTGAVGARITGVTSSVSGNKVTYTIPCNLLATDTDYLIELPRGSSGNKEYDVELRLAGTDNISISGPSVVCSGNVTFTANNVPAGMTLNWTRSSNLAYVSGQGTNNYTVRSTGSGPGNVTLTVSNACGSISRIHPVESGALSTTGWTLEGSPVVCNGSWVTYRVVLPNGHQPHYTYNWTWPSGWIRQSQNQNAITLSAPSGSGSSGGTVNVTINNGCGASAPLGKTVYSYPCSGAMTLNEKTANVYPNPADETLVIELEKSMEEGIKDIRLLNNFQKVVKEKSISNRKLTLDVRDLPPGLYYLVIGYKGIQESHHVMIE